MKKKNRKEWPPKSTSLKAGLNAEAAHAGLKKLPTTALVNTIDTLIGILDERGVKIRDWDEKDKVVQKIKIIGGKVYVLAPSEKPEPEEKAHGEKTD